MKKLYTTLLLLLITAISHAQCWKSVSVGYSHVIAIGGDGSLWAWGMNHFGQLGDGTFNNFQTLPIQIGSDTDWKTVSAGTGPTSFNLAMKENGTLWSWGNNAYGQLGDGTFVHKYAPVQVGTDTDWSSISAGYSHSLATKLNGTVWSWGDSNMYALGYGNGYGEGYHKNIPTQIGALTTWKSVSAADKYSLAVKFDGTVWGWGYDYGDPIDVGGLYINVPTIRQYNNTNVKMTSAGGNHSFDVKNNNLLVAWGSNTYGQNGGTTCAGCPVYYVDLVECGDDTSAVIKTDGTLWYTGKKLGYDAPTVQYTPSFLELGNGDSDWQLVSVGHQSGAALRNDGSMWTWGWNFYGQLGVGTSGGDADSLVLVPVTCPATLGVRGNEMDSGFGVYPNPAERTLYIQNSQQKNVSRILILDITGKVLTVYEGSPSQINIENLQRGVYIIEFVSGKFIDHIKFIKK